MNSLPEPRPVLVATLIVLCFWLGLLLLGNDFFMDTSPPSLVEQQMVENLRTVQRGDFIETVDGGHLLVLESNGTVYSGGVWLSYVQSLGFQVSASHVSGKHVKRIVRHDTPEAIEIWMKARPVPEEKVALTERE